MGVRTDYKYTGGEPLNREPEIGKLLSSYITKAGAYDRNHSAIPTINPTQHILKVDGEVFDELSLTVEQLQTNFEQHEVLCSLQCAGNRRHTMRTEIKEVQGIDWSDGAVMNCLWKGPRLKDVILTAGVKELLRRLPDSSEESEDSTNESEEVHETWKGNVVCACYELPCQDSPDYGGSVTLERAMMDAGDCILALEMNGKPLTPAHGAPVRALFPGILGARSVKWLNRITLQLDESSNFYQQHDYKILPPEAVDSESAAKFWAKTPSMSDMPINSIIGIPNSGTKVTRDADGAVEVRGYALPAGMDGPVVKVEVSGDDGSSWVTAELDFGGFEKPGLDTEEGRKRVRWAWCLWKAKLRLDKGPNGRIVCRAVDFGGNVQPRESAWNLRGVGFNAWGEVKDLEVV